MCCCKRENELVTDHLLSNCIVVPYIYIFVVPIVIVVVVVVAVVIVLFVAKLYCTKLAPQIGKLIYQRNNHHHNNQLTAQIKANLFQQPTSKAFDPTDLTLIFLATKFRPP